MKKIILLVVSLVFVATLFASGTRVATMGGISYGDPCESGTYPGLTGGGVFWAAFNGTGNNNYFGGIALDVGPGALAIDMNMPVPSGDLFDMWSQFPDAETDLNKIYILTYAMKFGEMGVGVNFGYGSDFHNTDDGTIETTEKSSYMSFGLGASNDMFDFGFKFGLPNCEYTNSTDGFDDITYGGSTIELHARYLPLELGGFNIIPVIGFGTGSIADQDDDITNSVMQFGLNTIIGYDLSEKTKALFDLQLFGMKTETIEYADTVDTNENGMLDDFDDKEVVVSSIGPFGTFRVGVESNLKPWLIGRFGAVKNFNKETETITPWGEDGKDDVTTTFDEDFALTFGLGFQFNKFILDVNFEEELLIEGPNFITGKSQSWASEIGITYLF